MPLSSPRYPFGRPVRSFVRAAAILCLGLTTAWAGSAAAQSALPDECQCTAAAGSDDDDRDLPWWLFGIPLIGAPIVGGGRPPIVAPGGPGGTPGGPTPPGSPMATAPMAAAGPGAEPTTAAPVLTPAVPGQPRETGASGLVAPNTATNRPTLAAAGVVLLLLGALHRRNARRRAEALAAAARSWHAGGPPRVLFNPHSATHRTGIGALAIWPAPGMGGVSTVAGICCLAGVGLSFARGAVAAWEVRSNWAKPSAAAAAVPPGGLEISAIARLEIPAIGLTRLVGDGVDERTLAAGPGHIPQTVAPGLAGLSVISAHRDLDFRGLGALGVGDTVVTTTRTQRTVWRVVDRVVVPKDSAALLPDVGHARLALTTCWPIRYFGPAPERLLVFAEPVHQEPAPAEPVRVASR